MVVDTRTGRSRDDYVTPDALFRKCNECWGPFEIDLAASIENAKCARFYSKSISALDKENVWEGRCWCNPPYGRVLPKFMEKALTQKSLEVVVFLLPCRPGSKWFRKWYLEAWERRTVNVILLSNRIKFEGEENQAQFDSMLAVYGEPKHVTSGFYRWFDERQKNRISLWYEV